VIELGGPATEKARMHRSLGTVCERATPEGNQSHGLPANAQGALVTAVASSGPAEQAGIRPGDLLIALDGDAIASPDDLVRLVSSRSEFASVKVALLRGAERKELPLTLGLRATSTAIVRNGNAGTPFTVSDVWLAPDGKLAGVSLLRWRPPAEFFLRGKTTRDMWNYHDRGTEQAINDAVIEWKTREFPGWLRLATAEQLSQGIIDTEKGILALDLVVRTVKDQLDAAARKNEITFAGAGEVEQLLEQRKMLLGVVLQAMKGAAAEKPGPL
jgi:membrane-associated protease RseP (regulator of RpoE activity)